MRSGPGAWAGKTSAIPALLLAVLLASCGAHGERSDGAAPAHMGGGRIGGRGGSRAAVSDTESGAAAVSAARTRARGGEPAEVRRLIGLGRPIYCAGRHGREVALTFDDGPGPYTHLALRKLRSWGDRATFFVVGRNIPLMPSITRRERALGAVGDHTFTHPLLTALPAAQAEGEIVRAQAALARSSGAPVFLFRPPYGAHDRRIDSIARAHGLLEILWTVDSADSLGADYAQIARNVIAGVRPGAIILMHENRGQTIRALASILPALRRRDLRAVSVSELLSDDPPSRAQLRAGGLGCGLGRSARLTGD